MRRAAILLLFALPAFAAEPSKFTLAQSGASADPLTVLGPAAACVEHPWGAEYLAIPLLSTNTDLVCSSFYVANEEITAVPGLSVEFYSGPQIEEAGPPKEGTSVTIGAGFAAASTDTEGAAPGGDATLAGGDAARLTSGNANGGDVVLQPGSGVGTGTAGNVFIASGNLTGPAGGFSIIGGTAASDTLTLDSTSNATNGAVKIAAGNSFRLMLLDTDAGNYESLNVTASAGAFNIRPATAGAGSDNIALTLAGEGATGTVVLDGSDDVAGSVTVSANGMLSTTSSELRVNAASGYFLVGNGLTDYLGAYIGHDGTIGYVYLKGTMISANATDVLINTPLRWTRKVQADIDGETTTAAQSGTVWTNTGDGDGEAITLLNDPTIGVQYCFAVDVAQTITVAPSTGETLYYGTDNCVASLTSNAIGSTLCVTAITGGSGAKWFTMSHEGSWTCND